MKSALLFSFLCIATNLSVFAQQRIDSLYYTRTGELAPTRIFADYLRIALYPADSTMHKEFKDFYISGELRQEGYFLHIDSLNDNFSRFDGEIITYYKNGQILEKKYYSNGVLNGMYQQYTEKGTLKIESSYLAGELSGLHKEYDETGACKITEYNTGIPMHDYYFLADSNGNYLKFRISDDMPIWESPAIAERIVDYRDGIPWEVYFKNGLTISLTSSIVRDYENRAVKMSKK